MNLKLYFYSRIFMSVSSESLKELKGELRFEEIDEATVELVLCL